jgi:hypothetical protein
MIVLQEILVRLPRSSSLVEALRHPVAFLSGDSANIRRLAAQIDCSLEDAEAVYRLARRTGYASAYRSVFGASGVTRRRVRRRPALAKAIRPTAPQQPQPGAASGRSG